MAFAAIVSAVSLTSCSDEDTPNNQEPDEPSVEVETEELSGTVEGTLTLDASKEYHLTGTLTFPMVPHLKFQPEQPSRQLKDSTNISSWPKAVRSMRKVLQTSRLSSQPTARTRLQAIGVV